MIMQFVLGLSHISTTTVTIDSLLDIMIVIQVKLIRAFWTRVFAS